MQTREQVTIRALVEAIEAAARPLADCVDAYDRYSEDMRAIGRGSHEKDHAVGEARAHIQSLLSLAVKVRRRTATTEPRETGDLRARLSAMLDNDPMRGSFLKRFL
jgi:hypothetical protein